MCTILTIDRAFFSKNAKAVRKRIQTDSFSNSDGYSLLVMGKSPEDTTLLRAMNIESILGVLETMLGEDGAGERAWLHCRMATTSFVGVNGCHGFAATDYTVFHNGVLYRPESNSFDVDSELIAWDIVTTGREGAIEALSEHESYANVFIVNNKTGTYDVIRKAGGQLFTDGKGNYSTCKFSSINRPVSQNVRVHYDERIVLPPKPAKPSVIQRYGVSHTAGDDNWPLFNNRTAQTPSGYRTADEYSGWTESEIEDYREIIGAGELSESEEVSLEELQDAQDSAKAVEIAMQIECLPHLRSLEDFEDMAEYEGWFRHGIPYLVYAEMNAQQLAWVRQLELSFQRLDEKTPAA